MLKKRQNLTIFDNDSMKDKFCCFCCIACFYSFAYFVCKVIRCSKRILFFADLKYCSLLLLSFVEKFFAFHENYSLFAKKVIRRYFENKSYYSWMCFEIILGRLRKLFVVTSRVSWTILRGSRKLFFGHMKIYVFVFCFKVLVYLVCHVLPCVVLCIVLPVLPCVLCRVLSHHHAAGYNVK